MNSIDAQMYMNELGRSSVPFLFVIDFEKKKPLIFPFSEIPDGVLFSINGKTNHLVKKASDQKVFFKKFPVSLTKYKSAFESVIAELNYGNSFLLNLTFPTKISTSHSIEDIYNICEARYKLNLPNECVTFSPEIFVQIKDGKISSNPMKGTISANIENAKELLLSNLKEIAEHHTIVDLIRNDLSMVAKRVCVKRFRYIEEIATNEKNLLQVSSEIEGFLPLDYSSKIGDIVMKLLPAGSISGAPKKKTLEIIRSVEGMDRGYYTGVFGYFDGSNLDSGVMIRYIEQTNEGCYYRSGGGITANSNLHSEFNEMLDKIYVPITREHKDIQRSRLQYSLPQ